MPPLTGSKGSGVMIRLATPASNGGFAGCAWREGSIATHSVIEETSRLVVFIPTNSLVHVLLRCTRRFARLRGANCDRQTGWTLLVTDFHDDWNIPDGGIARDLRVDLK